jgi:hypothetical protein
MQKKNSVIKNYILSTKKRILEENPPLDKTQITSFGTSLYHSPLKQNKDSFFLFLSRK